MTAVTIAAGPGAPVGLLDRTLASLPVSFTAAARDAVPDVVVVGGIDWASDALRAVEAGCRGIVISAPAFVPSAPVRTLAERARARSVSVVVADPVADHPGLAVPTRLRERMSDAGSVTLWLAHSAGPGGDSPLRPSDALLRGARLLRILGLPVATLHARTATAPASLGADGTCGSGAVLSLLATASRPLAHRARVQVVTPQCTVTLDVPSVDARPARVSVIGVGGELVLPRVYETAERAAWRRIHAELTSDREPVDPLPGLVEDLARVEAARG